MTNSRPKRHFNSLKVAPTKAEEKKQAMLWRDEESGVGIPKLPATSVTSPLSNSTANGSCMHAMSAALAGEVGNYQRIVFKVTRPEIILPCDILFNVNPIGANTSWTSMKGNGRARFTYWPDLQNMDTA